MFWAAIADFRCAEHEVYIKARAKDLMVSPSHMILDFVNFLNLTVRQSRQTNSVFREVHYKLHYDYSTFNLE